MNVDRLKTNVATKIYRWAFPYILAGVSIPEYILKYRKYKAVEAFQRGFVPHINPETPDDVIDRLLKAYREAKQDQVFVGKPYQVGYLWQEILDTRFKKLTDAIDCDDIETVKSVLENFNREECGDDTCGGGQYYDRQQRVPLYRYQFINAWYKRIEAYNKNMITEPEFEVPNIGNPVGLLYGNSVVPLCNIEYGYYAEKIKDLLKDIDSPVICEIGGGVGGQAFEMIKRDLASTYMLFDIPETLLLSSYYLMMAFPEKKIHLYGEAETGQYDIKIMPNFMLKIVQSGTVDLVFNSCSFSEMDYDTAFEYGKQISRICNQYLMHINHDARLVWYENGNRITNMLSSEVKPFGFDLVYKKHRQFSLLEDTFVIHLFYKARYFEYLYRRKLC